MTRGKAGFPYAQEATEAINYSFPGNIICSCGIYDAFFVRISMNSSSTEKNTQKCLAHISTCCLQSGFTARAVAPGSFAYSCFWLPWAHFSGSLFCPSAATAPWGCSPVHHSHWWLEFLNPKRALDPPSVSQHIHLMQVNISGPTVAAPRCPEKKGFPLAHLHERVVWGPQRLQNWRWRMATSPGNPPGSSVEAVQMALGLGHCQLPNVEQPIITIAPETFTFTSVGILNPLLPSRQIPSSAVFDTLQTRGIGLLRYGYQFVIKKPLRSAASPYQLSSLRLLTLEVFPSPVTPWGRGQTDLHRTWVRCLQLTLAPASERCLGMHLRTVEACPPNQSFCLGALHWRTYLGSGG